MMPRLTADWDAIIASVPLDKGAGVVTSRDKSGGFVPRKKILHACDVHSPAPLKTKAITKEHRKSQGFQDFTGLRVGRLFVVGLADFENANRDGGWVVRCACGYYEHRKSKTLKKYVADPARAMCTECDYLSELRKGNGGVQFPKQTVGAKR
jgi:hypothetical protein